MYPYFGWLITMPSLVKREIDRSFMFYHFMYYDHNKLFVRGLYLFVYYRDYRHYLLRLEAFQ